MKILSGGKYVSIWLVVLIALTGLLGGCAQYEPAPPVDAAIGDVETPSYRIGAGDALQIFVWRNPEVSSSVIVRPDGKISTPLIEDLQATGLTPSELARHIESELATYIQDPLVTIIVSGFVGEFDQQVRVIGEASQPRAIPYRANMTVLDVMIAVGGLTNFAAGNRATIVRVSDGQQRQFGVRLNDLIKNGDISANTPMVPGDVLIIPESWF